MDLEETLFLLRLAAVGVLYLFVVTVVIALRATLAASGRTAGPAPARPDALIVLDPGATNLPRGTVLPLAPSSSIGRLPQSTVYLDDPSVSGRHATLTLRNGTWVVEDLGSTNGTFVDGERVNTETPVGWGSILTVGRVRLSLERLQP